MVDKRKEFEERSRKRTGNPSFGGRTNWDTYEADLIIDSDEELQKNRVAWSKNFNRKIRAGTFNETKAKEALNKYLLKKAKKRDPDIDLNKVNMNEFLDETILLTTPSPVHKRKPIEHVRKTTRRRR